MDPPPRAVQLPPARGERDHQAAAAHQASAAPSAAAAAAAAYPTPRQQQPQQTTQRQQQQQTTRRLQSTQRSSAQRSSGSSSTSSSSTSSRPPEARLAFVHPLWPQVCTAPRPSIALKRRPAPFTFYRKVICLTSPQTFGRSFGNMCLRKPAFVEGASGVVSGERSE